MPDQPLNGTNGNPGVHLLLVEDNDIDAELLLRAFRREKIANPVTRVTDGLAALDALRGAGGHARVPRPTLILLDIHMPRMSGLEFLDAIRDDRDLAHSVVYLLITDVHDEARFAAYAAQLAGYIPKQQLVPATLALLRENGSSPQAARGRETPAG